VEKYSTIKIRETRASKRVKIGSELKPEITKDIVNKWQSLIDTAAKIAKVPSGLIMRLNKKTIEVFLSSRTEGNPVNVGKKIDLIYGIYCETVIATQRKLLVPNAMKNIIWKENNPALDDKLISYIGFPINWPDGEVFGTVCVLDKKENFYSNDFSNLLDQIKQHLETDLQLLLLNADLKNKNAQLKQLNSTKSRFLSLISHDIRGSVGTLNEFLKLILEDYDIFGKSELKPMIKSLSNNASYTYETLEALLTWSKNDLIHLKPNKARINIVPIIDNILNSFKQELLIKKIKVKKEYFSENIIISADEKMMNVIIRNILSNAIKYTKSDGIITIRIFGLNKQHIIEIEDTGIGMDKSKVDNLFSYDTSHSNQGTNGESSSGIGLMLVKDFIDKNDIKVVVESQLGKGTLFRLSI